jgi:hypothetical protein
MVRRRRFLMCGEVLEEVEERRREERGRVVRE